MINQKDFKGFAFNRVQGRQPWPFFLALALCLLFASSAYAQFGALVHGPHSSAPVSKNAPVTFTADSVSYDKQNGIVTATGHVEAYQNDHIIRADRMTFDRNTNVVAATGHVVIAEPDGQVLFADYAELTQGMREGVLSGMRSLLALNGRLAANGARRTDGKLNELSRAVYSTCNVCALDPEKPPLWDLSAYQATQDLEHKRIEYQDAWLDILGQPVLYLPYFSNADPSVKRESGFLIPGFGLTDKHLGSFVNIPYYLVINSASDVILTPTLTTGTGPQLAEIYRLRLNDGILNVNGALAYDEGAPQGYIQAHGLFDYNDTWRYGFDINQSTSLDYERDFHIPGYGNNIQTSQIYTEGFGDGTYARLDVRAYQALNTSVSQVLLPYVLPRYSYDFFGTPDALGGRLSFHTEDFNILRDTGTNDQRGAVTLAWNRPFVGSLGDVIGLTLRVDAAAYHATTIDQQPNFDIGNAVTNAHAQPLAAARMNWPFVRNAGTLGTQLVEPIAQLIVAPNYGNSQRDRIPNEDSLDYEFTDSTLFSLNRFQGYDRFDSGPRANVGLHLNWTLNSGQQVDALVGQSYQEHRDANFYPQSGLGEHVSDIISRVTFVPSSWLDFTARGRFDKDNGDVHFADGIASVGVPLLRLSGGYIYSNVNPYDLYLTDPYTAAGPPASFFIPRSEATFGATSRYGQYSARIGAQDDLRTGQLVSLNADARYENECFIFDVNLIRRYTSIDNDNGDTTVLFTVTFKTVGAIGFTG